LERAPANDDASGKERDSSYESELYSEQEIQPESARDERKREAERKPVKASEEERG